MCNVHSNLGIPASDLVTIMTGCLLSFGYRCINNFYVCLQVCLYCPRVFVVYICRCVCIALVCLLCIYACVFVMCPHMCLLCICRCVCHVL